MANRRRMFSVGIVTSDAFNGLPPEAQAMYFRLGMIADDDGVVASALSEARAAGIKSSFIDELVGARFLIALGDGLFLIKHWKINNAIPKDRYAPTTYTEYMENIDLKENGAYTEKGTLKQGSPNLDTGSTKGCCVEEGRVGESSVGESSVSSEPTASEPPVITILTNSNEDYPVYADEVNEWQELYPSVDVMAELRKMKGWSHKDNPKRKTAKGMKRFITSWLAREQDKGGNVRGGNNDVSFADIARMMEDSG